MVGAGGFFCQQTVVEAHRLTARPAETSHGVRWLLWIRKCLMHCVCVDMLLSVDQDGDHHCLAPDRQTQESCGTMIGVITMMLTTSKAGKPSPHTTTKHPHSANLKLASLKEEYFHQLSSTYTPLTFHLLHPTSTSLSMQMT